MSFWTALRLLFWLTPEEKETIRQLKELKTLQVGNGYSIKIDAKEVYEQWKKNK